MILCGDTLFIHVPKVGGMSATAWLLNNLDGPMHVFIPESAQAHALKMLKFEDVRSRLYFVPGGRHETIPCALKRLDNWKLPKPKRIFSFIRPSEDLVSSYFHYIRRPGVAKRMRTKGISLQDLEYAESGQQRRFAQSCKIFGKGPACMMHYYWGKDPNIALDVIPLQLSQSYLTYRFGAHKNTGRLKLEHRNISQKTETFDSASIAIIKKRFQKLDEAYNSALKQWTPIVER